jgi:hypothetical protein
LQARLSGFAHAHEGHEAERVAKRHQAVERHILDRSMLHIEDDGVIARQAADLASLMGVSFEPKGDQRFGQDEFLVKGIVIPWSTAEGREPASRNYKRWIIHAKTNLHARQATV